MIVSASSHIPPARSTAPHRTRLCGLHRRPLRYGPVMRPRFGDTRPSAMAERDTSRRSRHRCRRRPSAVTTNCRETVLQPPVLAAHAGLRTDRHAAHRFRTRPDICVTGDVHIHRIVKCATHQRSFGLLQSRVSSATVSHTQPHSPCGRARLSAQDRCRSATRDAQSS